MRFTDGTEVDVDKGVRPANWPNPGTWVAVEIEDSVSDYIEYGPPRVLAMLTPTEARQFAAELIRVADEIAPRGIDDDPLLYAIAVIESYQSELRNSDAYLDAEAVDKLRDGKTLTEIGFCQGTIYTEALGQIRELAKGQR